MAMKLTRLLSAAAIVALLSVEAEAQSTVAPGSYATYQPTVGVTDSTIVPAGTVFFFLDIVNNSSTATVCLNFGAAATIAGTVCAAGEITLPPLWHRSWENNFIPNDAIHAIASAASTPVTVGAK